MSASKELEIIRHTTMNYLEIFLVEMTARELHGHSDMELGILLEGSMTLFLEHEQYDLRPGDIYLINRYQIHSFRNTDGRNLILAFQIHTDFYRKINYQLGYLQFESNIIRSGHLYQQLRQELLTCADYYFKSAPFTELKCCSVFLNVLYLLLQNTPYTINTEREHTAAQNNSRRISHITEYIAEHYQEHISLEDIAALENVTVCHVSHFIKKMLGISFQEYLNNIRFDHALQLIHQTDLNILDICMEVGFSSSRYLNQMFQKTFGCTTKEYLAQEKRSPKPEKALPVANLQKRFSYESSALLFQKKYKP